MGQAGGPEQAALHADLAILKKCQCGKLRNSQDTLKNSIKTRLYHARKILPQSDLLAAAE